jgi:YhcN/YlaJ family sporulation lipoprotein
MKSMFPRKLLAISLAALLVFSLAGCMNTGDDEVATPAPTIIDAGTPGAPGMPGAAGQPTGAPQQGAFDWQTSAQQVENAVSQLSEVTEARVLVAGNTALVGVQFDQAYQGEMTERIREMIAGVVKDADPNIETVAVTADETDVTRVYDMSDRVRAGEMLEDFRDDILSITRNATTLR